MLDLIEARIKRQTESMIPSSAFSLCFYKNTRLVQAMILYKSMTPSSGTEVHVEYDVGPKGMAGS